MLPSAVDALRCSPARRGSARRSRQPSVKTATDRRRSKKEGHKGGKGKPNKGKAKKGQAKGQSAQEGGRDRPAGEPDQQIKAQARKRPNKVRRRGRRSNKALLRR